MWDEYQVIRAAKSDSRLANNNLPPDVQKLRCRACYQALRFAPPVEAMGKLLADRMRSYGPYTALHLRYEKDMLTFTACLDGGLPWFHNVWYGVVWYGMVQYHVWMDFVHCGLIIDFLFDLMEN
ncbi:hypothetical protein P3L10_032614 [Capsicum annuum]